jgi:signal transduction histidine kinase
MEAKQKQDRLSAIGQMLAGIIHDLKTPLTIINGYAQLMTGDRTAEARLDYKERIQKQIGDIQGMTSELLAFARGESEILLRKVHMRVFLKEIEELLAREFEARGSKLVIEDLFGGSVKMDESKMRRVVSNLARNALEAMGPRGTFKIRVEAAEEMVALTFEDDGPGIPQEMSGRLFESFATHGKEHGTGLGLAIVKKIVDEHGGTIRVNSGPGQGTVFRVELPTG